MVDKRLFVQIFVSSGNSHVTNQLDMIVLFNHKF